MPRVLNVALAGFVLLLLSPVVAAWDRLALIERISVVLVALPFVLLAGLCLASAARPGSLGRAARRARARRQR